jgi:hypothetical protein
MLPSPSKYKSMADKVLLRACRACVCTGVCTQGGILTWSSASVNVCKHMKKGSCVWPATTAAQLSSTTATHSMAGTTEFGVTTPTILNAQESVVTLENFAQGLCGRSHRISNRNPPTSNSKRFLGPHGRSLAPHIRKRTPHTPHTPHTASAYNDLSGRLRRRWKFCLSKITHHQLIK